MGERTLEVDWTVEHTTIVSVNDDGRFEFSTDSHGGPVVQRVFDHEGGSDIDRDSLHDFLAEELC